MRAYEIISKKRDGGKLYKEEIELFVSGYTQGKILDYQMSALLMAIFLKGMDGDETKDLTWAMMKSGEVLDWDFLPGIKVDKHSTGGVGDKVSLILAPLVASCGVYVPMISGRGLGHTGGTLDKLKSIPGFRTDLSLDEFKKIVSEIKVSIMEQTDQIAPADKKIYALRDVTATVESIPLICSSILSKKFAEGIDALVLDVKVGNGAFMDSERKGITLAKALIEIGNKMKKKIIALITNMNEPLGEAVGNSLEVIEAIEALKGKAPKDLMEVTLSLCSYMLILGKKTKSFEQGQWISKNAIESGDALSKFKEMIKAQGGNVHIIDNYSFLPQAKFEIQVKSSQSGYVKSIDTKRIGLAAVQLGAGRQRVEDKIDPSVGFLIKKKVGDYVEKGETLVQVLANDEGKGEIAKEEILEAHEISKAKSKRLRKVLYLVDRKVVKRLK
jgi:pyrimidine-nucleoside phosphorylase